MKTITALFLLVCYPMVILSQEKGAQETSKASKNLFLDFSVGASIPLGSKYPGLDIDDEKAGFATTGFYLHGTLDWLGKRNLGLAIQITYQSNPISSKVKNDTVAGNFFPIGSGNWQNIYLMAGPVFLKPIQKFIVDVKLLGGFIISTSPVFSMTNPETKQKEEKTATGFGMGVDAGAAYKISEHLALRLNLGYLAGFPSASKEYFAYVLDPGLNQYVYTKLAEYEISKVISTFNGGVGLLIFF